MCIVNVYVLTFFFKEIQLSSRIQENQRGRNLWCVSNMLYLTGLFKESKPSMVGNDGTLN